MSNWLILNQLIDANRNLVGIRREVQNLKDQQLRQKKLEVLDKIKTNPPSDSTLLFSSTSYTKDIGSLQSTKFYLGTFLIIILTLLSYQFVDPFSAVIVLIAGLVSFGWFMLKPIEHEFSIFNTGILIYGSYLPWEIIQGFNVINSEGKISGISFKLKNEAGEMPFWFNSIELNQIIKYLESNI